MSSRSRSTVFAALMLLGAGCTAEQTVAPQDASAARAGITAHVFGDTVSPDDIVAQIDGHAILASDVAAMAMLFPTLTTEQLVQDLVDARVAAAHGDPETSRFLEVAVLDGERRGLMSAWMWDHVWSVPGSFEVSDEEIEAFIAAPENTPLFGRPQLARTSQIIVQLGSEEARPEAERVAARIAAALNLMPGPMTSVSLQEVYAIQDLEHSDGVRLGLHEHTTFPRRYSGPADWANGVPAVIEPYAAAAFDNSPGSVVGPVASNQGYHILLVEDHIPATFERTEETVEIARQGVIAERNRVRFVEAVDPVFAQVPYQVSPDATRTLAATGLERVEQSREARGEMYQ